MNQTARMRDGWTGDVGEQGAIPAAATPVQDRLAMPTIVKLTNAAGVPVYVNADRVTHFSKVQDLTYVHFGTNDKKAVNESPGEVAQIIRHASGQTVAAHPDQGDRTPA